MQNKYTQIKGLSDSRRMPRLSKIRLGAKVSNGKAEYPVELPFFLLPDEVAAVHGGKITNIEKRAKDLGVKNAVAVKFIKENGHRLAEELPVMIPVEDTNYSFPQSYKLYGGSIGLKCIGDGEMAEERVGTTNEFKPKKCPCNHLKSDANPKGDCTIKAHLSVMLPEVSAGGIFQIDMGSINSIVDINSGIEYVRSMIGRVAMVPLKLRRIPTETHHDGKKQTHFTCQLTFAGDINDVVKLRGSDQLITHNQMLMIEAPDYSDPKEDAIDMQYEQPQHIKDKIDELTALAKNKKVLKSEGQAIAEALFQNDEETIVKIYEAVKARNSGATQAETAEKLKQTGKNQDEPEKSENNQEPPPGARF